MRRRLATFACSCALALLAQAAAVKAAAPDEATTLDCGVNALFVLLQLEGRGLTFERIEEALTKRDPRGYSMAELRVAAGKLGLSLEGVRFTKGDKALPRPAIVFLQGDKGGHFAVLRPVGTTGTMVQVIDPPYPPWITDYDRLFAEASWTGRILIARDSWPSPIALLGATLATLIVVATLLLRLRKARSQRIDGPATTLDASATQPSPTTA